MNANTHNSVRQKVVSEVREMTIIFVYLALFFCTFMTYRRLVMQELGIGYFHYGFALLKALVMAKVILVGQHTRVSRMLDHMPLIVPTVYKVFVFSIFTIIFEILEHVIESAIRHRPMSDAIQELLSVGRDELLSRTLVVLVALLPLFAFREIGRIIGEGKLHDLFFRKRPLATAATVHE